jgi:23S rRNA pseudouridine2605 synthase
MPVTSETGLWLAQFLARTGVGSRRDALEMIRAGRVRVQGTLITDPQTRVTPDAKVTLDGQALSMPGEIRLWKMHKPIGCLVTRKDPANRPTVFDLLPEDFPAVQAVGRLDYNSEGLLLLTNHGGLARHLTLPKSGYERQYKVRIYGRLEPEQLNQLIQGIDVDGIRYQAVSARVTKEQNRNSWLDIVLKEGKNREIRQMMEGLGVTVNRLIRVRFGSISLGDLERGAVQEVLDSGIKKKMWG